MTPPSDVIPFDLYARENALLAEAEPLLADAGSDPLADYLQRLVKQYRSTLRDNLQLTRHADRQQAKLFDFNRNLKKQSEELEARRQAFEDLSHKLAKYLAPQVHDAIFSGRQDAQIATRRKKLTVFFSDIQDFTSTAESMQPEALTDCLNEYFSLLTRIALAHGATIDKYIGDAMMLFFGDPESRGVREDARACVKMAVEMQQALSVLRQRWRSEGFTNLFQTRMGINTGYCNVGNFGSDQRLAYTIIGAEVNLTARIESCADTNGILISHETYAHVTDMVHVQERPPVTLKGISREIQTYAVQGFKDNQAPHKLVALHHPAGVAIDVDLAELDEPTRLILAQQLREALQQIDGNW
jgi:class 3 adenylate cyclase